MRNPGIFILLAVAVTIGFGHGTTGATINSQAELNNRPVIGVLAQESPDPWKQYGDEYVMSQYIKYLEMAGAAVVVLRGSQPKKYYVDLFNQLNGVLMPGGAIDIMKSPYATTSRIFFDLAKKANDAGDFFPMWGTCQGFEMMSALVSNKNLLTACDAENIALPLSLVPEYKTSRLLGKAPKDIIAALSNERVTANFHYWCVTTETFNVENTLNGFFRVISTNKDRKGLEFVSTMEAVDYPFYGVQWHPEVNAFTQRPDRDINHSAKGIAVTQYFANFFVNEARKSKHKFTTEKARSLAVVENDVRVFTPEDYIENFYYNITTV